MRKHIGHYQIGRNTAQRTALFRGLVVSLITQESLTTTATKAMAVRPIFEKLLTRALTGTVPARRAIQAYVQNGKLVTKLVNDIAPRYKGVLGGYTKITPIGARRGDNAKMVKFSLTKMKVATPTKKEEKSTKQTTPTAASAIATHTPVTPKSEKVTTVKLAAKRAGKRGDR